MTSTRTLSEDQKEKARVRAQKWRKANRKKHRDYNGSYKRRNRHVARKSHLKTQYGLTTDAWDSIFAGQGKRCAICKTNKLSHGQRWCVDHSHATGDVRGILCPHCNWMLGHAKDSPETLVNGAAYLKERNGSK